MRLETGTVLLSAVHSLVAIDVCHYHSPVRYHGMSKLKMCSSKALFIYNGNSYRTTKQNKSRREGQRWRQCRTASPRRPVVSTWGQHRWSVPGGGGGSVPGRSALTWSDGLLLVVVGRRRPLRPLLRREPLLLLVHGAARTVLTHAGHRRLWTARDGRRTVRGRGQGRRWEATAAGDRDRDGRTRGQDGRNEVESKTTASYVEICKTHKHSDKLRWSGGL